jgi:hypothetical protein
VASIATGDCVNALLQNGIFNSESAGQLNGIVELQVSFYELQVSGEYF